MIDLILYSYSNWPFVTEDVFLNLLLIDLGIHFLCNTLELPQFATDCRHDNDDQHERRTIRL